MTPPRFEFSGVSKQYDGRSALSGVSFAIAGGDHTAILGPSGSGKSTVLRLLAGLETPSSGRILADGKVISEPGRVHVPPHRRGIGMVFQDLALWPNLTASGNVLLGLAASGLSRREAQARTDEALAMCGIQPLAGRKPGTLSGGQQQRAALARAIAARPAFLLLDEPFSGLDLVIKSRLVKEIAALAARQGLTVILVSHDPMEATAICSRAIVLEDGRIQESGAWADVLGGPNSETLRTFKDQLKDIPASRPE
jgi:ABC-type Fe3+/spermidine/putrescine transport system ATPase subunit